MTKKATTKKNYIYNLVNQILTIILPIITIPYVSRILSPEGVGQNSFCHSIVSYFILFATLGFGIYGQREISKYQDDKKEQTKALFEILICKFITTSVMTLLHFCLYFFGVYGNNSTLMLILTINIVAVLFDISFFFQGNENFKTLAFKNMLIKIIGVIFIFVFVVDSGDLWIYVLINSLVTIVGNLFMWPSLKGNVVKFNMRELKPFKHIKPALKLFIPSIALSIYVVLDKSLIGIITQSNVQNGYYEQTEKIAKIAVTILSSYAAVMIPRNSYEYENGRIENVKHNVYNAFHFVWVVGIPIFLGLLAVAGNLVPWFLGEDFAPSINLLRIFSLLIMIIGTSDVLGLQYLIPSKQDNKYTISLVMGAVVNLTLNLILIPFLGALGACIATIVAELSISLTMFIFVRKELDFKNIFKTIWKPLLSGIIMFVSLIPCIIFFKSSLIMTLIMVMIGVVVYGVSILLLKDSLVLNIINILRQKINKLLKKENSDNIFSNKSED